MEPLAIEIYHILYAKFRRRMKKKAAYDKAISEVKAMTGVELTAFGAPQ